MISFIHKEITQIIRSSKVFVFPLAFLLLGFLGAVTAKYTPEIIKLAGDDMLSGINIPTPTFTDAYAQFFGNIGQIGFIVTIFMFMGVVVEEKIRNTAALTITKNISRTSFIVSKLIVSVLLFSSVYLLAVLGHVYYTYVLFKEFWLDGSLLSFASLWLYGILIVSFTLFSSTVTKSMQAAAGLSFTFFIGLSITAVATAFDKFNPVCLATKNMQMLDGSLTLSDLSINITVTIILILFFAFASILSFRRQEL